MNRQALAIIRALVLAFLIAGCAGDEDPVSVAEPSNDTTIWVDFVVVRPGLSPLYNVEIANTLADGDVLVFMDSVFMDTMWAGTATDIVVEEGFRELDFIWDDRWEFHTTLEVKADMVWRINVSE